MLCLVTRANAVAYFTSYDLLETLDVRKNELIDDDAKGKKKTRALVNVAV